MSSALSSKASMRATPVAGQASARSARAGARPARPVSVAAASKTLKLLPAKQTMAQQLACVSVQPSTGYTAWRPDEIVFSKNELVVGSDPRPGSPVDVLIAVVTVSRNHARLTLEGDKVIVTDLGSLNGTYVEGKRITKGERVPLAIGQTVSFEAERGVSYTLTEASFVQKAMASLSGGAAPAWSSEAEMAERVKDRTLWIANWRKGGAPAPAAAKPAAAAAPAAASSAAAADAGESWWKGGLDDKARANLLGTGGAPVARRPTTRKQIEAVLPPDLEAERIGRGGVSVERKASKGRQYTGYVPSIEAMEFNAKWAEAQKVADWHAVWTRAAMQAAYSEKWAIAAFESEASRNWASAQMTASFAAKWAAADPAAVKAAAAKKEEKSSSGGGGIFGGIAALFGGKK